MFTDARDADNPIIFANDAFLALTGYDRKEVLGQDFNFLMAHAADEEAVAQIEAQFKGHSDGGAEIRYRRKDGSTFWAGIFISPVHDEAGDVVQYFASFVDLTRHMDEEAQSKMLIEELNHRVKNTLSTVQSIVWQAMRMSSDTKVIRESIESRLLALSRSHDLLARENWQSAGFLDVVGDALAPFVNADGRPERVVITGESIRLPPRAALALGIAFNELATNAVKYGALSNETGSVLVEGAIQAASQGGERIVMRWQEKGGPTVAPPSRKGFGSRVLEAGLPHELQATVNLDYAPDGVVCTISFPAPSDARDG